jgi:outer membrane phospholipase A
MVRVLMWAACAALLLAPAAVVPAQEQAEPPPNEPSVDAVQRFFSHFSAHEPLYFAAGLREDGNAKFQVSFRYRFLEPRPGTEGNGSFSEHLYFGYTQYSIWDWEADSSPFRDTSYIPSLFWSRGNLRGPRPSPRGLQIGIEHESNGQGGDDSRSLNVVYVQPTWRFGNFDRYHWTISPKIYAYVGSLGDNPDIEDYRGYMDLIVSYGKLDSWKFATMTRYGAAGGRTSFQVDVSYPLDRLLTKRFNAFVHLQYFNGWGESLLDYDVKRPSQIRLGLMLIR